VAGPTTLESNAQLNGMQVYAPEWRGVNRGTQSEQDTWVPSMIATLRSSTLIPLGYFTCMTLTQSREEG
jgi:hypothetical protein